MKNGFTLIEALSAIFVITIGLISGITLITRTISFMSLGSAKLTASYLAQEGIEIVRNIRDNNWLDSSIPSWDFGLDTESYRADFEDSVLILDSGTTHLNIDNQGFYRYDNSFPEAPFTRKITIDRDPFCDGELYGCIKVTVDVGWEQNGEPYSVSAQEYLYNWYQN